ncbi:SDR family NAD(P)-dependent oxidoreductase [Ahrensia sp. R2A130]|uniref:SDR family NAD(P)-dependent oxidoreductase n=1 Tax=Ahrensia sp. R2A130 TaxID=744979 RepID=UPI0001E09CA2|nr:SDR family oxidoreductase [Ahrensia sp. R2A130]EFL88185.1 2-deoxy-D-gluconate 3-dehydrogenase [Ahrensia sp. R2A130]
MTTDHIFDLSGKRALITGGGSGIGKAMAHALSDAGASIILVGRRKALLQEALEGRDGMVIAADLLAAAAPQAIYDACADAGALPDIIINAAGLNPRKHADDISPEQWQQTIQLNLNVPFFLSQIFVPHMKQNNWGRIINIASLQSTRAFTNGIAYGASKGGVSQLTRAMAEAWSKEGINANAIAPGFFPTELTAAVFENDAVASHHAAMTCIGRNGGLEDLTGPTIFLASEASNYVTGQILSVDGGYTAK